MRFHLKKNGEPGLCLALKNKCPLGGDHFETRAEALRASEKLLSESDGGGLVPKFKKKSLPETVVLGEITHKVVHDHEDSRFFCPACGKRFKHDDPLNVLVGRERARCPCGHSVVLGQENLHIQGSSLWVLDPANYGKKENVLYHVTTRPDWAQAIAKEPDLKVHLGDRETANWRSNDIIYQENTEGPFYLSTIRLKPAAGATMSVTHDREVRWAEAEDLGDITVYVNQYENPGSLSVMTTAKHFEVLGEPKTLTLAEARL